MRDTKVVETWRCDLCSATMHDEPGRNYKFVTGYAPIEAVGVQIHVQPFGVMVQANDTAVCLACLDKALRGILEDLFKAKGPTP